MSVICVDEDRLVEEWELVSKKWILDRLPEFREYDDTYVRIIDYDGNYLDFDEDGLTRRDIEKAPVIEVTVQGAYVYLHVNRRAVKEEYVRWEKYGDSSFPITNGMKKAFSREVYAWILAWLGVPDPYTLDTYLGIGLRPSEADKEVVIPPEKADPCLLVEV